MNISNMNVGNIGLFSSGTSSFGIKNKQLASIVQNINIEASNKNKFDSAEFNKNLDNLRKSKNTKSNDSTVVDSKPSTDITEAQAAEFADSSIVHQRDALESLADNLSYFKEKINYIKDKIEQYEKTAAGDFSEEDLKDIAFNKEMVSGSHDWEKQKREDAADMVANLKETLNKIYEKEIPAAIEIHLGLGSSFSKILHNKYGNIVSDKVSQVIGDVFDGLGAESLGLTDLASDPDKVLDKLNSAIDTIKGLSKEIENNYKKIHGKEMDPFKFHSDINDWKKMLESNDFLSEKLVNEFIVGDKKIYVDINGPIQDAVNLLR